MNKELEALNDMLEYLLTYDEFNKKRHKHNAEIIENALKLFNLLNENDIDIWLLKHCDYENYCRIRRLCLEGTGNADKCSDCDIEIIDLPSKEEFDLLKEVLL